MRLVYLDNASSTPMGRGVLKAMKPYLTKVYGNPSSVHKAGLKARMAIEKSREDIAKLLGCNANEIFFTSGASEANAWVSKVYGCEFDNTSHDSIRMANQNNKQTIFSVPMLNSETGRPSYSISKKEYHIDLTQCVGKIRFKLHNLECVAASLSGHKFGAPKGVGLLYIREDKQKDFVPLIYGHQEGSLRGGTENVAGIVGMSKALDNVYRNWNKNKNKIFKLRYRIERYLTKHNITYFSSENIVNITFNHLNAQTAVLLFDKYNIEISAGSACNAGSDKPSDALLYYGYTEDEALRTIRVSLGVQNTRYDIHRFIRILKKIIDNYDKM